MGRKDTAKAHAAQQINTATEALADQYLTAFTSTSPLLLATCQRDVATQRVKVWSADDNRVLHDVVPPAGAMVTALSWGVQPGPGKATDSVLAMCLSTGAVQLYSVVTGQTIATLSGAHTAAVNDFVFTPNGRTGISASNDQFVVEWDLVKHVEKRKYKHAGGAAPSKLALSRYGNVLAVADSSVTVVDLTPLSEFRVLAKVSAHASQIVHMSFIAKDTFLVTAAEQDRFVNCYDVSAVAEAIKSKSTPTTTATTAMANVTALAALSMDQNVAALAVAPRSDQVLAVSEDGVVHLWSQVNAESSAASSAAGATPQSKRSAKRKKYTSRTAESTVRFVEEGSLTSSAAGEGKTIPVVAATFTPADAPGQGQSLRIARGTMLRPVFETVQYSSGESNELLPPQTLERSPNAAMFAASAAASAKKVGKQQYRETSATATLHSVDFALPEQRMRALDTPTGATLAQNGSGDKLTLAEKLASMQMAAKSADASPQPQLPQTNGVDSGMTALPNVTSLHTVLTQAIHTQDQSLLESVLNAPAPAGSSKTSKAGNSTGSGAHTVPQHILSTVRKLPTVHVVSFLNLLVDRFQREPARGMQLLDWIRTCLIVHAGYLMTVPDLVKKMSLFYQSVESRLAASRKLLKLQGRLELVLSQVEMRNGQFAQQSHMPVYREGHERETDYSEEDDDGAQYEDLSHPSLSGNNLRPVKRRAQASTLRALAGQVEQDDDEDDQMLVDGTADYDYEKEDDDDDEEEEAESEGDSERQASDEDEDDDDDDDQEDGDDDDDDDEDDDEDMEDAE
ncbi:Small subunit (SSU) processome component [Sorochytrium milnesiophthora]